MENQQQANQTIPDSNEASPDSNDLNRAFITAFRDWLQLYNNTAWTTDPEKRRSMLQTRLNYQEAKLKYFYTQGMETA